jgi:hypothetical protein
VRFIVRPNFIDADPIRFSPHPVCATLLVAAAACAGSAGRIALRSWPQQRMQARGTDAPPVRCREMRTAEFRHIRLRGHFLPSWTLYLDNRLQRRGRLLC